MTFVAPGSAQSTSEAGCVVTIEHPTVPILFTTLSAATLTLATRSTVSFTLTTTSAPALSLTLED